MRRNSKGFAWFSLAVGMAVGVILMYTLGGLADGLTR